MKNFHDLTPMPIRFEDDILQTGDSIMGSLSKQSVLCSIINAVNTRFVYDAIMHIFACNND